MVNTDDSVARVREVYTWDHERLWRSIYAFSGSREIADEAVAEAFAQALRGGDAIRDVTAWVWRSAFAIARTELADQRRHTMSAQRLDEDDVAGQAPTGHSRNDDDLAQLMARVSQLTESERQLLVWCHVGGWTPREIAPMLGNRAATVRLRLHRANRRARTLLADDAAPES